jgi:hypothetical protein
VAIAVSSPQPRFTAGPLRRASGRQLAAWGGAIVLDDDLGKVARGRDRLGNGRGRRGDRLSLNGFGKPDAGRERIGLVDRVVVCVEVGRRLGLDEWLVGGCAVVGGRERAGVLDRQAHFVSFVLVGLRIRGVASSSSSRSNLNGLRGVGRIAGMCPRLTQRKTESRETSSASASSAVVTNFRCPLVSTP